MNNYQEYSQLLTALLKCGYRDLKTLVDVYQDGVGIGAFNDWELIITDAEALGGVTFNNVMYSVLTLINNKVFGDIIKAIKEEKLNKEKKELLIDRAEDRMQNFNPQVNYGSVYFNNEIDESPYYEDILKYWLKEVENE